MQTCSFEMPLNDGGGFEKGNDAMQDKFKGKGAPLVQAAAVVAVAALFGSEVAMAGAGTTINTALSLAGGIVGLASGRFSLGQVAIPGGVGVGAGTGVPIVTAAVTATV